MILGVLRRVLGIVFLILGLVLLLVFLILLLLLLFFLLLLFLELVDLLLHEVAVVFRLSVVGGDLQGSVVGFHRLLPGLDRLLRGFLPGLLAHAVLGVSEVVIRVVLQRHLVGVQALLKTGGSLRVVPGFVGGGPGIEVQFGAGGLFGGGLSILLLRLGEVAFLVSLFGALR